MVHLFKKNDDIKDYKLSCLKDSLLVTIGYRWERKRNENNGKNKEVEELDISIYFYFELKRWKKATRQEIEVEETEKLTKRVN